MRQAMVNARLPKVSVSVNYVHVESLYLYAMTVYYSILKMSCPGFHKSQGAEAWYTHHQVKHPCLSSAIFCHLSSFLIISILSSWPIKTIDHNLSFYENVHHHLLHDLHHHT